MNNTLAKLLTFIGSIVWGITGKVFSFAASGYLSEYQSVLSVPFLLTNIIGFGIVFFLSNRHRKDNLFPVERKAVFYIVFVSNIIITLVVIITMR